MDLSLFLGFFSYGLIQSMSVSVIRSMISSVVPAVLIQLHLHLRLQVPVPCLKFPERPAAPVRAELLPTPHAVWYDRGAAPGTELFRAARNELAHVRIFVFHRHPPSRHETPVPPARPARNSDKKSSGGIGSITAFRTDIRLCKTYCLWAFPASAVPVSSSPDPRPANFAKLRV